MKMVSHKSLAGCMTMRNAGRRYIYKGKNCFLGLLYNAFKKRPVIQCAGGTRVYKCRDACTQSNLRRLDGKDSGIFKNVSVEVDPSGAHIQSIEINFVSSSGDG